ncbi:hypothetical protein [Streptomyces sp. NPDC005953]|uniref:hypothetical protein n=1 Tax=Streptomyces sp. NPDC005953 TaxID=3156719 RepID=UPI00340E6B89
MIDAIAFKFQTSSQGTPAGEVRKLAGLRMLAVDGTCDESADDHQISEFRPCNTLNCMSPTTGTGARELSG